MTKPRPVIIDCDPGVDDAVALMLALACPEEIEVLAITTVAGNVPLNVTEFNARRIRSLCQRDDVPVICGQSKPLVRPLTTAENVHGESGLKGMTLPNPSGSVDQRNAVDFIVTTISENPCEITVVAIGPLTNLALAIQKRPQLVNEVCEIVVMGGSAGYGNVTPHAEFNFFVDPHAAQLVFQSGCSLAMYGLDITRKTKIDEDWLCRLARLETRAAAAVVQMLTSYASDGGVLHDVLAVAHLLWPEIFDLEPCAVSIEINDPECLGKSYIKRNVSPNESNAWVGFEIQTEPFFDRLLKYLARHQ